MKTKLVSSGVFKGKIHSAREVKLSPIFEEGKKPYAVLYNPPAYVEYLERISKHCKIKDSDITGKHLKISAVFYVATIAPKSKVFSSILHGGKPDLDNIVKPFIDGMFLHLKTDDSRVVAYDVIKVNSIDPKIVWKLEEISF